jgi:hypothetical protein
MSQDPNSQAKRIFWLYGPAGAGKSAIAQSLCELCHDNGTLAASFFFSRGKDRRGTAKHLFVTLAYQISMAIPEIQDRIRKVISDNPAILEQSFDIQIRRLLIEPYRSYLYSSTISQSHVPPPPGPFLVIIDGLDECQDDQAQCAILTHIAELVSTHGFPLIFVIASRPEPHIQYEFKHGPILSNVSLSFRLDSSYTDIRAFLYKGFQDIHAQYHSRTLSTLPETWPSPDAIDILVQRSSGLGIIKQP